MDSSGSRTPCKNSTFGCTFGSSSVVDMVKHFQSDCAFHPVRCFKCNKTVRKANFEKHYLGYCNDNPAPACPAQEDVSDDKGAEAITTTSPDLHFLQEGVRECTLGLENLGRVLKDIAADVAEMKALKGKQEDLEAFVRGQAYVAKELSNSITTITEKVTNVQEDVNGVINRLDEDVETIVGRVEKVNDVVSHLEKDVRSIVERVENVDGFLKESTESKLCANMCRVMDNVAADVAAVKLGAREHKDLIKELEKTVFTYAENVKKVEKGIETIVQRVDKVDALVEKVGVLTRLRADGSTMQWYVENISQYIEKSKEGFSCLESDVFVVRGYSAMLTIVLEGRERGLNVGIFFGLCPGPNDSLLQWPFRMPYTLFLIHPKDASKTKKYRRRPVLSRHPEGYAKPSERVYPDVTCSLCTVEEVQNEGFIEDDALFFALILHEREE